MAVGEDGGWKQQLAYVPEVVLKKRKHKEESIALTRKNQLESGKFGAKKRKVDDIKRPEHFIHDFRNKELDFVRKKTRMRRLKPKIPLLANSKLLFVVRVMGKNELHPTTKKTLSKLNLKRLFHGVFLKATEPIVRMLQQVEPYVTYGYPNCSIIKGLILKKGHGKIGSKRVPLIDNNIIEQELGKFNVICLEDIVHEVCTVGQHFKEVVDFLGPFELTKPKDGLKGRKTTFVDGGDSGQRKEMINDLIFKMN